MPDAVRGDGPAILVANGRVRVGSLVYVGHSGCWLPGTVVEFDVKLQTVVVNLDDGGSVTVDSSEVHRINPGSPNTRFGSPRRARPECLKCNGKGERRALLGLSSKMKLCKACDGTGHSLTLPHPSPAPL
eukprot:EG_transcript_15602